MTVKVKVCCPLCGQTKDIIDLPQHIETNHVIAFTGLGSRADFSDGELVLHLNPAKPYSYTEAKLNEKLLRESWGELVKKIKPGPGGYPIG